MYVIDVYLKEVVMFINPRCISPSRFCIVFCMRTNKTLSMGSDKCHICMGILNDLDSILGLICIIFVIYAHISPIMLGSAYSGF